MTAVEFGNGKRAGVLSDYLDLLAIHEPEAILAKYNIRYVLFPPGDSAALTEALVALLDDEPRRAACGVAARKLAQDRYSWEDIGRRLAAVYSRVTETVSAETAAVA